MGFLYETLDRKNMSGKRGVYVIDHEEYHAGPGVSSSQLKAVLSKSPAHAQVPMTTSPAMAFGTAFHMAVLEPELFSDTYVTMPKFDRRTKAGKAEHAEWMALHEGKSVIAEDDLERIRGMSESVFASRFWDKVKGFDRELSVLTQHKATGLDLKCRPDMLGSCIIDVKTTRDASPHGFKQSLYGSFGYVISAAYYQDICADVLGKLLPFFWCAVEKEPPYGVAWYEVPQIALDEAARQYQTALQIWHECLEGDRWPGYPDVIETIDPPPWFFK